MDLDFLDVRVLEGGLAAEIAASPHPAPSVGLRADELGVWLCAKGMVHGLIPEAVDQVLRAINERTDAWGPTVIARGTPPLPGKPGRVTFHFEFELKAGRLAEEGDRESAINFRERGAVHNVREGQLLVERIPPSEGTPGLDVLGRPIAPTAGAKAPMLRCGGGVTVSEDGLRYVASRDGNARLAGDTISVENEFVVPGDLDFSRGNVDFVGSVRIHGTLKSGFSVRAKGDVHVHKHMERGARIEAEGNVLVDGDVVTGEDGMIAAAGNLDAGRLENARVRVDGDVRVREEVRNADIECKGRFEAIGAASTIRGSRIEAVRGIRCREVGTEDGAAVNHLHAGLTLRRARRLKAVGGELKDLKAAREHIFFTFQGKWGAAATSRARADDLPADKRAEYDDDRANAQARQEVIDATITALSEERNSLELGMAEDASAEIQVSGTIWPTTEVAVKEEAFTVRNKPLRATGLALKDNRLVFKDLKTGKLISLKVDATRRTEVRAAPGGDATRRLSDAINARKLTPAVLAGELEVLAYDHGLAMAADMAKAALKDKRYQTTRIYSLLGRSHMEAVAKAGDAAEKRTAADSAAGCFEQAIRKDPDHVPSLTNLAVISAWLGKYRESMALHERALRAMGRHPADPEIGAALYNYGATLLHLADRKNAPPPERAAARAKALEHIRRYLELFPDGPKAGAAGDALDRLMSNEP